MVDELDGKEIEVKAIYPDNMFHKIIEALIEIRRSGTHDTYMEFFGSFAKQSLSLSLLNYLTNNQ